jgi:hypothetical protein
MLHTVKIVKAKSKKYWYADKIGDEFTVYNTFNGRYCVVQVGAHEHKPSDMFIDTGDVEILETFRANVIESLTISIERLP